MNHQFTFHFRFLLLDYKPKVDTEYVSDKVKAQLKVYCNWYHTISKMGTSKIIILII